MTLTVDHATLAKAINLTARALPGRHSQLTTTGILVSVKGNQLTFSASDGELHIQTTLPIQQESNAELAVPGKQLSDVVNKFDDGPVDIAFNRDKSHLRLAWQSVQAEIYGWNQDISARVNDDTSATPVSLSSSAIKNAIQRVLPAVSTDETRPVLTGVLLHLKETTATFVATDGFRLSVDTIDLSSPSEEKKIIIPTRFLNLLAQQLNETDEETQIMIRQNSLTYSDQQTMITSSLISGQFPNYEQLIPASFPLQFECPTKAFISACDRARIFADEKTNAVSLTFDGRELTVQSKTSDRGEIQETLPSSGSEDRFSILFNSRYLLDAVRYMDGDTLTIDAINPTQLIRITSQQPGHYHIVLPLRQAT